MDARHLQDYDSTHEMLQEEQHMGSAISKILRDVTTPNGHVQVIDHGCQRWLCVDGCVQGRMDLHTDLPLSDYMRIILAQVSKTTERVLVLGGGAYLMPKELLKRDMCVDVVEQNEHLLPLACSYFRLHPNENFYNYCMDAKMFQFEDRIRYDTIILDLYNGYDGGDFYKPEYINFLKHRGKQILVNKIVDGQNKVEEYDGIEQDNRGTIRGAI